MNCDCSTYPDTGRGSTVDQPFVDMEEVGTKAGKWVNLLRCSNCGQHWQVDEWDKYQIGISIKVNDPDKWEIFEDLSYRKDHLLRGRGGTTDEICVWQDCEEKQLIGSAYCPEHSFEIGGMRE